MTDPAPPARTPLICPFCGQHEGVFLSTPDYGYGYGAEFAHCCGGERRTWSSKTEEARAISAASRALSRENAAGIDPYKRGFDDGRLAGLRQAAGWVGGTCPNCAAAIRSIADALKAPKTHSDPDPR